MSGLTYAQWYANAQAQRASYGGSDSVVVSTFPSNAPGGYDVFGGMPAVRYSNDAYGYFFNTGGIDPNAPQVASNSGQYVYVVAPQSAADGAPQLMTAWQRFLNASFSAGDTAADAVGLGGSLDAFSNFLKDIGKEVLIGVTVAGLIAYLLKRRS